MKKGVSYSTEKENQKYIMTHTKRENYVNKLGGFFFFLIRYPGTDIQNDNRNVLFFLFLFES